MTRGGHFDAPNEPTCWTTVQLPTAPELLKYQKCSDHGESHEHSFHPA
jgi:hypothetical protein